MHVTHNRIKTMEVNLSYRSVLDQKGEHNRGITSQLKQNEVSIERESIHGMSWNLFSFTHSQQLHMPSFTKAALPFTFCTTVTYMIHVKPLVSSTEHTLTLYTRLVLYRQGTKISFKFIITQVLCLGPSTPAAHAVLRKATCLLSRWPIVWPHRESAGNPDLLPRTVMWPTRARLCVTRSFPVTD